MATSCSTSPPAQATISIEAGQFVRRKQMGIGGTNIASHHQNFANGTSGTTAINFKGDLAAAKVKLVRCLAYPDDHTKGRDFPLSDFDAKVRAIIDAGAVPLFVQYIKPGLKYLDANGRAGTGGTPATNLAYLVKRYKVAPYSLYSQYWEVGNEPDNTVDYKVSTPGEYSQQFNAVHQALVTAGVRESAILCGPAITHSYHGPWWGPLDNFGSQIMDKFLTDCAASVDIVTYHIYSNEKEASDTNWRYNILNKPRHLDNKENANRMVTAGDAGDDSNTSDIGVAALVKRMRLQTFSRPLVGIGVTEHNSGASSIDSLQQGLWNLAVTHFHLYNNSPYRSRITNSFIFDWKSSDEIFGHYNVSGQKGYGYWALWMRGNLTGSDVVQRVVTGNLNEYQNPYLLVSASKDATSLYVEVINRSDKAISESVAIKGVTVQSSANIHQLSATSLPDTAKTQTLGPNFTYSFPAFSATVFKFSLG